jgi:hypothetical protein
MEGRAEEHRLKRIDDACREPYTGEPNDMRIIVTGG